MISHFKREPPCPLSKISEGPVGQSLEITNLFKVIASNNTFGRPSNLEDSRNIFDFFMWVWIILKT